MSKNFRSSFIDLLSCRYSKRHLCTGNDSVHNRGVLNAKLHYNSAYTVNDCHKRSSVVSRFSQLHPLTSPPINHSTNSAIELFEPAYDGTCLSPDNSQSCHITVGTQTNSAMKSHRRRKHDDRPAMTSYSALTKVIDVIDG
jgi:hypothetical protein